MAKSDMARYRKETADYERRSREKDNGSLSGDSGSCTSLPPHEVSEDVSFENAVTDQFETLVDDRMEGALAAPTYGNALDSIEFEPCPIEISGDRSRHLPSEFLNPPPLPFMRPYQVPDFPPQDPNFSFAPSPQMIAQQRRIDAMNNELSFQQSLSRRMIQDQFRTSNVARPLGARKRMSQSWGIAPMADESYPNAASQFRGLTDDTTSAAKGTTHHSHSQDQDAAHLNPFEDNCWEDSFP